MMEFIACYLLGTTLGELGMFALWAMKPANATLPAYWIAKRGNIIMSGVLGCATCTAWGEGTILKWLIDWRGYNLGQTYGISVLAGFIVSLFAHQIIRLFAKKSGLDDGSDAG